jgi:hypothetical protein
MKVKKLLVLLLLFLPISGMIFQACKKGDNPAPAVASNCRVTRISWNAGSPNRIDYQYGPDNQVISINEYDGQGNLNRQTAYSYITGRPDHADVYDGLGTRTKHYTYLYGANGRIETVFSFDVVQGNEIYNGKTTYQYSSTDVLYKEIIYYYSGGQYVADRTGIFTFDGYGNETRLETTDEATGRTESIDEYTYDNQKNAYAGLDPEVKYTQESPNNYITAVHRDGYGNISSTATYGMEYNSNGYPTKMTLGTIAGVFEYACQ